MKFRYTKQEGIKDCGVAVLYNIIKYYGGNINIEKLRNEMCTNKNGTSIYNIVKTANKYGLESKSYKCELDNLASLKFPLVAHIIVEEKYPHFIILKRIDENNVYIFDPIRGDIVYSLDNFLREWSNIIITFKKSNNIVNEKDTYQIFLKSIFKNNSILIYSSFILSVISTILTVINSVYLQIILDNINNNKKIFLIFTILIILKVVIDCIKNNIIISFNKNVESKLISDTYNHILSLPIQYHHSRPTGDIVSRVNDLYYVKDFINQFSFKIIIDIVLIIIISLFLFYINIMLFIISMCFIVALVFIHFFLRNNINNLIKSNQIKQGEINSILVENLFGIDTIKNLALEKNFLERQNKVYHSFLLNTSKLNKLYSSYNMIVEFIISMGINVSILIGSILMIKGNISTGELFSYNLLLINFYNSILNILSVDNLIMNSKSAYKRISNFYNVKEEEKKESEKFKRKIEFKNLKYSYNSYEISLKNDLKICASDNILITGQSGIGKSTMFKLLTKQLDNCENMIFLDGKDINKFSSEYLKSKICYVSQKEYLFTDTIENNIKLYKKVDEKDFKKALKVSMVDKILEKRNINLNYILEENGHNLSGGERQKIILARTLLTNKDFIILDETMNEIDILSERKIIKKIKTEYNKTLVLISHRKDNKDLFNKYVEIK